MRVDDAANLRTHAVDEGVHLDFAGDLAMSLELAAVEVDQDEVFGLHHALADARGGGEDHAAVDAGGDIAVHGRHEPLCVQPSAEFHDLFALCFQTLHRRPLSAMSVLSRMVSQIFAFDKGHAHTRQ